MKLRLGASLAFTPTDRYGSHSVEFDAFSELGAQAMDAGRVTLDLGLRLGL